MENQKQGSECFISGLGEAKDQIDRWWLPVVVCERKSRRGDLNEANTACKRGRSPNDFNRPSQHSLQPWLESSFAHSV